MSLSHSASVPSFNTQPPEGGWQNVIDWFQNTLKFQHTAARRRLGVFPRLAAAVLMVSTHSRPKAAGGPVLSFGRIVESFNTQPPEGGWLTSQSIPRQKF